MFTASLGFLRHSWAGVAGTGLGAGTVPRGAGLDWVLSERGWRSG